MSRITLSYFLKLHEEMMNTNIDYRKGYQYAKRLPYWDTRSIDELKDMLQAYIDVALRDGNTCAMGHAHAVREAVWRRIESSAA